MHRISNYVRGISPRTRFLIVYFMVMGFGATTFTRLAESINAIALVPVQIVMAFIAWREDGCRRDVPLVFGCLALAWGMIAAALGGRFFNSGIAVSFLGMAAVWFFMLRTSPAATAESVRDEFSAVCTVYLICYMPLLLIALVSLFTGIAMHIPGDDGYAVGIVATGNLTERFRLMDNANDCARIEMMCVLFAIYLFINRKQPGWRIFSAVCGLANLMVLSHTQSRSGAIALAAGIGVIAFSLVIRHMSRRGWRVVLGLAACAVVFFITLSGINLLRKADVAVARRTAVVVDETTIDALGNVDTNGQFDVTTSGRPEMWRRIFEYLRDHPRMIITGITGGNVMDVVDEGTGITWGMGNTHNAMIDCITTCGLPFLVIILAFLIYMIPKCWKVVTGPCSCAEYIFAAIIVAMLTESMSEVSLFACISGENSLFMLVCGYVLHSCRAGERTIGDRLKPDNTHPGVLRVESGKS